MYIANLIMCTTGCLEPKMLLIASFELSWYGSITCAHMRWMPACTWWPHIWYHLPTVSVWKICGPSSMNYAPWVMELSWGGILDIVPFLVWLFGSLTQITNSPPLTARSCTSWLEFSPKMPQNFQNSSRAMLWAIFSVGWVYDYFAVVFSNTELK